MTPSAKTAASRLPGVPLAGAVKSLGRNDVWRAALTVSVLAVMLAFVAARHEPWFDEAQAWLTARDSSLWELLAQRVRYEGSPGLWHAILWLLSHAGYPYAGLWLVSTAFACAGAWVVLRHAPFPFWLRVAIVFSYFFAYQYAVIARSYSLMLLLVPLLAATFASRLERPLRYCVLLGLCANTSAHGFIVTGLVFGEFLLTCWRSGEWQRRSILSAVTIFLLFAGAAVLQARPPVDASFASKTWSFSEIDRAGMIVREAFIDRLDVLNAQPPILLVAILGSLISLVLLLPSFLLFKRAGHVELVAGVFLALLAFSVVKYANAWHAGILYLFWIFALWISWDALRDGGAMFGKVVLSSVAAIVLVNDCYTVTAWWREVRTPYSAGPAAARLLAPRVGGGIAAAGFKSFAVQPWFGKNVFANYRNGAPEVAYFRWQVPVRFNPRVNFANWQATAASRAFGTLVLSTTEMDNETIARYEAAARAASYCRSIVVPGELIWKSYVREDDTLLIFPHCPSAERP